MTTSTSRIWAGEQLTVTRGNGSRITATTIQTAEITSLDFSQCQPVPKGARLLDDYLDEMLSDAEIQQHLPTARAEVLSDLQEAGRRETLAHLRLAVGMSQADLARVIKSSQSMVSLIEARRQKPGEDTLRALSSALGVSFDRLMAALSNGDTPNG